MRFYTNVTVLGNNILVRGYENGRSVKFKEEFYPTLFVKSNKESKYKTLEGESVEPINQVSLETAASSSRRGWCRWVQDLWE